MTRNETPRKFGGLFDSLSEKQREGVLALLTNDTLDEAAKSAGISRATLFRWRSEQSFADALGVARSLAFDDALLGIRSAAQFAVEALKRNLDCGNPSVEVRAAATVLDLAFRAKDMMEFEGRIAALEATGGAQ